MTYPGEEGRFGNVERQVMLLELCVLVRQRSRAGKIRSRSARSQAAGTDERIEKGNARHRQRYRELSSLP